MIWGSPTYVRVWIVLLTEHWKSGLGINLHLALSISFLVIIIKKELKDHDESMGRKEIT